jgi:hypothetical protein
MGAVMYGVALAAAILAVWWLMSVWARRMWGKAYDKPLAMGEMMERVGVAPETMATLGMRGRTVAAARKCADCNNEVVCRDFLDGKSDRPVETFCANAELFASLKK